MLNNNNEVISKVITDLLEENLIPSDFLFDITEHHLESYIRLYGVYKDRKTSNKSIKRRINYPYARKLAGLTLIKLKLEKGAKVSQCREGFIYTVKNPAWPEHVKIGMTVNIDTRLAAYQTYSPYRDYEIAFYDFVLNRRGVERDIFDKYHQSIENGEWIKNTDAKQIIDFVRKSIPTEPFW